MKVIESRQDRPRLARLRGFAPRARVGWSRRRVQRGGLSFADRRTAVHSTSEDIDAGPGDPDPDSNPDRSPQRRHRSGWPVEWHQMDLCRAGLPADADSRYRARPVRPGLRLRLEPRIRGLPKRGRRRPQYGGAVLHLGLNLVG